MLRQTGIRHCLVIFKLVMEQNLIPNSDRIKVYFAKYIYAAGESVFFKIAPIEEVKISLFFIDEKNNRRLLEKATTKINQIPHNISIDTSNFETGTYEIYFSNSREEIKKTFAVISNPEMLKKAYLMLFGESEDQPIWLNNLTKKVIEDLYSSWEVEFNPTLYNSIDNKELAFSFIKHGIRDFISSFVNRNNPLPIVFRQNYEYTFETSLLPSIDLSKVAWFLSCLSMITTLFASGGNEYTVSTSIERNSLNIDLAQNSIRAPLLTLRKNNFINLGNYYGFYSLENNSFVQILEQEYKSYFNLETYHNYNYDYEYAAPSLFIKVLVEGYSFEGGLTFEAGA